MFSSASYIEMSKSGLALVTLINDYIFHSAIVSQGRGIQLHLVRVLQLKEQQHKCLEMLWEGFPACHDYACFPKSLGLVSDPDFMKW